MMERSKQFIAGIIKDYFKRTATTGAEGLGELGSGAGKGGGGGGSIREAGGSMGKYGAANEEVYFYKRQREQLLALKREIEKQDLMCAGKSRSLREQVEDNKKHIAEFERCFGKMRDKIAVQLKISKKRSTELLGDFVLQFLGMSS